MIESGIDSEQILDAVLAKCEKDSEVMIFVLEPSNASKPNCITNIPEEYIKTAIVVVAKMIIGGMGEVRYGDEATFNRSEVVCNCDRCRAKRGEGPAQ